jgi:hypothetical protein
MVGLQSTAIKARLGPLLNGWTNYDAWLPVPKLLFAGVDELNGAVELCSAPGPPAGSDSDREPRRRQARRLYPGHHFQDRGRQRLQPFAAHSIGRFP